LPSVRVLPHVPGRVVVSLIMVNESLETREIEVEEPEPKYDLHIRLQGERHHSKDSAQLALKMGLIPKPELAEPFNHHRLGFDHPEKAVARPYGL